MDSLILGFATSNGEEGMGVREYLLNAIRFLISDKIFDLPVKKID